MNLSRSIRRYRLIPRAKRVKFEREMADLDAFLAKIRETAPNRPPWPSEPSRRVYADEVE